MRGILTRILLCLMLFVAFSPRDIVYATEEQVASDPALMDGVRDALQEGEATVRNFTSDMLWQVIQFLPYVGVVLFVIGIFVAIFSTRNKGNRRWGLKLAITEAIIVFLLYIALILVYDFVCNEGTVQFTSRPAQENFYEKTYFDTVDRMKAEGQSFLFLGEDWIGGIASAGRSMYMSIFILLIFVSVSIGALLLLITKRDAAIRRFALAGLCIASPLTLIVGAVFLK